MNEFEEQLRECLEDYLENGDRCMTVDGKVVENKGVWENSKKVEYVYKQFPLWGGHVNQDNKRETIHALVPKQDYEAWLENKVFERGGIPIISSIDNQDCMVFATKEVVD